MVEVFFMNVYLPTGFLVAGSDIQYILSSPPE